MRGRRANNRLKDVLKAVHDAGEDPLRYPIVECLRFGL